MTATTPGPRVVVAALELPDARLDVEASVLAEVGGVVVDRRDLPLAAIREELAGADAVLTEGLERFDADVIAGLLRCRVISVYAVGTDGVDVDAATRQGIVVTNVPDYCAVEVAEHAVALILATWRKLGTARRVAASGSWGLDDLRPIHRLAGRTVGLVGLGRIAREVAARLRPFGVALLAYDPYATPEVAGSVGVALVDLDELLASSDVVSIHVPLTPETRHLLDGTALARMRPGAVLVNAGRGGVVDETALVAALDEGGLAGAALDVLPGEPPPAGLPLLHREDVLVTPHMGYYSEESLVDLRTGAARNAMLVLSGRPPSSVVNPAVLGSSR